MAKETAKRQDDDISTETEKNDATPSSKRSWGLARSVVALTGLCVRNPIPCLSCSIILAIASIFFAFCYLKTSPANFQQTLSPGSLAASLNEEYFNEVANPIEACIVVEQRGASTTKRDIENTLSSICFEILGRPEYFNIIATGLDGESFKSNRLFFYSPEEYKEATELAVTAQAVKRSEWSQFAVDEVARKLAQHIDDDLVDDVRAQRTVDSVVTFAKALVETTTAKSISPETAKSPVVSGVEASVPQSLAPDPYYLFHTQTAQGGGVMFTFVDSLSQDERRRAVAAINLIVQKIQANHPRTIVEATGLPFIERREFDAAIHALRALLVFFFASVTVFFWAFFGRGSRALMALTTLLISFCWLLGVQTLAFKTLTPDNFHEWFVVMCVAVASVATYLSKYVFQRRKNRSASEALMATAETSGASLASLGLLACSGSLIFAFFCVVCRTFFIMCGIGIALSITATLVVLPTLIKFIDGAKPFRVDGVVANLNVDQGHTNPYLRTIAVVGMIVAATLTLGLTRIQHDPTRATFHGLGFENLRAQEAASQYLESRALYGVLFADSLEDARRVVAKLNDSQGDDPSFYVECVSENLPNFTPDDILRVEAIHDALQDLKPQIGQIPVPPRKKLIDSLVALRKTAEGAFDSEGSALAVGEFLTRAIEQIETLPEQEYEKRIDAFSRLLVIGALERLYALRDCSEPHAPALDDLSNALKTRYLGQKTGRLILRVYSLRTLSDSSNLVNFVRFLREIDPNATGPAVLSYEQGLQTGWWITIYLTTMALIFMIVAFVRFRSLRASIAFLIAPLVAMLETAGAAGLLNIAINPVNWCVFPCVFFLTLYSALRFAEDYEEFPERFFSYDHALATCIAATIIAGLFAFGLSCQESGWQNLARIGILSAAIYAATTLLLLPALLNWSAIKRDNNT